MFGDFLFFFFFFFCFFIGSDDRGGYCYAHTVPSSLPSSLNPRFPSPPKSVLRSRLAHGMIPSNSRLEKKLFSSSSSSPSRTDNPRTPPFPFPLPLSTHNHPNPLPLSLQTHYHPNPLSTLFPPPYSNPPSSSPTLSPSQHRYLPADADQREHRDWYASPSSLCHDAVWGEGERGDPHSRAEPSRCRLRSTCFDPLRSADVGRRCHVEQWIPSHERPRCLGYGLAEQKLRAGLVSCLDPCLRACFFFGGAGGGEGEEKEGGWLVCPGCEPGGWDWWGVLGYG